MRGIGLAVGRHRPGDQPGSGDRADGHQAGVQESAPRQWAEGGRANIGVRAVFQVIDQVQQDDRFPVSAEDLEDPLHRVPPAEQHLPVRRGQVRPGGHEPVHHGLAVWQAVLQREPVDDPDRLALVQLSFRTGELQQGGGQRPLEARPLRELDQIPFQIRAALDEQSELLVHVLFPPRWPLCPQGTLLSPRGIWHEISLPATAGRDGPARDTRRTHLAKPIHRDTPMNRPRVEIVSGSGIGSLVPI